MSDHPPARMDAAHASQWWGPGWWPGPCTEAPGLFDRYPWRTVALHARTLRFRQQFDRARAVVGEALEASPDWRLTVSGGKDSSALLAVAAGMGHAQALRPLSIRDDLCWPGEDLYLDQLGRHLGVEIERVWVDLDLTRGLKQNTDTKTGQALSAPWFRAARLAVDGEGVMWGLRREESKMRAITIAKRGRLYRMREGLRAAPLADWQAIDVHAALMHFGVAPHPVYGCIDPWQDPLQLRHSWFVVGVETSIARKHYDWLARWWPLAWSRVQELWPDVRQTL